VKLVPAQALDLAALTRLFNEGFSGYLRPMSLDETGLARHIAHSDIDLASSQVVTVAGAPVAFALAGRRGTEAWIGGMGTAPAHRRRGLGERALTATIEAASRAGCTTVWLEVIDENHQAIGLYEKLGFQVVRDVVVWSLPATGRPVAAHRGADVQTAQAWIASRRPSREPWQRADATLERMRESGWELRAVTVPDDAELAAAALYRGDGATVHVLQAAAQDEAAATEVLLAAAGHERTLRFANAPAEEAFSVALEGLGADLVARQDEMRLQLS
jgi:ribosomal protein S18 acetylase RimI-like enzyme